METILSLTSSGVFLDLNIQNAEGCTPLAKCLTSWGQGRNSFFVTTLLLKAGSDLNIPDYHGIYPLMDTVENRKLDLFAALVHLGNADVNSVDSRGRTALHLAVLYGQIEAAYQLVRRPHCNLNMQVSG